MAGSLRLVPIYLAAQEDLLTALGVELRSVFRLQPEVMPPPFDPEVAFDPCRGQYNSRVLLRQLLEHASSGAKRVLGVTAVDLFIPVLTYVFGEAQLDGTVAVVSLHRLRPEGYGLEPDPALLRRRLLTEAVHELGHTFGLVHCDEQVCVMHSSSYAEEIDLKSAQFCRLCAEQLIGT